MLLFFIRHGDPIYNPDSLTPLGHRQAEAVGRRLCQHGIDRVFSSPMVRAQETAQPTCEMMHLKAEIEPWTSEHTAWTEMACTFPDGRRRWAAQWPARELLSEEVTALGAEWHKAKIFQDMDVDVKAGYDRIVRSSDEFFSRLGYDREGAAYKIREANDQRIALFAHGGFGVSWMAHMMAVNPPQIWAKIDIAHTGVTVFDFQNNADGYTVPRCLCLSDLSHLYAERLPYRYSNGQWL